MSSTPSTTPFYSDTAHVLPRLARVGHAGHVKRCLSGLPDAQVDLDSSRMAVAFYCIGSLDLLGLIPDNIAQGDIEMWREWIWEQHISGPYGSGFRPSPFVTTNAQPSESSSDYDTPHVIMTYTAILILAILRDDFSRLDRQGLIRFLKACQRDDGSFGTVPSSTDTDLRTLYCAFVISSLLDNWSGIDVERALAFVASCRTYEGGYGISTNCEAQGGTTYIALASIYLAPPSSLGSADFRLTPQEKARTSAWLLQMQHPSGGFCGRTNKDADACYCFWCGAALKILSADHLVDSRTLVSFLADCQFRFGGIAKAPGEHPDPYHTYLSLAALSMYPPPPAQHPDDNDANRASWVFEPFDPLINARQDTTRWAREKVAIQGP